MGQKRKSSSKGLKSQKSPEEIYELLIGVMTAEKVTLVLSDHRVITGTLIFHRFNGTGRIINLDLEINTDFSVADVADVRVAR